jgi:hypothetical protein
MHLAENVDEPEHATKVQSEHLASAGDSIVLLNGV